MAVICQLYVSMLMSTLPSRHAISKHVQYVSKSSVTSIDKHADKEWDTRVNTNQ
jgi:hypothetical protein